MLQMGNAFVLFHWTVIGFTAAKWLMKLCKEEVLSIDTCADCYANAYIDSESRPWFTLLCAKPHLLLWAKQRNCPFWTAKLLAVNNDKVSVRFFGKSHGRANVPAIDCRLYSQINPSKSYAKQYGVDLSLAQQVFSIDKMTEIIPECFVSIRFQMPYIY